MTTGCRLPRSARLSDDKRIEIFRSAARVRGHWFVVRPTPNAVGYARVLIRVAKRVIRGAVARNRIKRCVREVFRRKRTDLPHYDYLVSVINHYAEPSLVAARRELEHMLLTHREQR